MAQPILLIVGLGNPGSEYARTPHNAGFWFVDALAAQFSGQFSAHRKLRGESAEVSIGGARVRLLKPSTFMNLSGESVQATLSYFRIPLSQVLVACDEIDFPPGKVRLKFGGGHAGHNGLRNIITHVGPEFWRLRIGVGHPGDKARVISHVLRAASGDTTAAVTAAIERALAVIPELVGDDPLRAQNLLHTESDNGN